MAARLIVVARACAAAFAARFEAGQEASTSRIRVLLTDLISKQHHTILQNWVYQNIFVLKRSLFSTFGSGTA